MKNISNDYKNEIYKFGRQIDSKITYELDGETIELGKSQLNSVSPHYDGSILKSVMKQLDIESSVDIPVGTILNYQFGLFVNGEYEYINFGNYIVKSSEKQEDTRSYKIVCYDKILNSMKEYENFGVEYPITIRDYIIALCEHLELDFANAEDEFANYDKEITKELYLDENGASLDYTFRDVLDELAQTTASTICINNDDELELRYINKTSLYLPEGYTQVEYISSTNYGHQYIDTLFTPNFDTGYKVEMQFIPGNENRYCLISNYPAVPNHMSCEVMNGKLRYYINNGQVNGLVDGVSIENINTCTFEYYGTKWKMSLNGVENSGTYNFTDIQGESLNLFVDKGLRYGVFWASLKIYSCKIYNGNILVRNFIPCYRNSDNEIGLYDTVNNVFYTNDGDNADFICGEEIIDTINEKYLKDINVNFGEKFGPVNTIVLARAGGSDRIYKSYPEDLPEEDKIALVISENQIMNFNDRDTYLDDILNQLKGLEYYINDFSSTGITYYELCDLYNIQIDNSTYKCIMLNDEINITQGLEELIHTEKLGEDDTDYKKADKTDRKVNQTYIIADKQRGQIEALTSRTEVLEGQAEDTYTKEQTNQLLQDATSGLTNTFRTTGGNNIFRNTGLWFETITDENLLYPSNDIYPSDDLFIEQKSTFEFWRGDVIRLKEDRAVNFNALLLQQGTLYQEQEVPNGTYTISFKYQKLIEASNVKIYINDAPDDLTSLTETEYTKTIEVSSRHINIQFITDVNNSCEIYDLMVNTGDTKAPYSQNQNETTTDTVNISKGITITSSEVDTTFKANADGVRIYSNDDLVNPKTKFTDKGTETDYLETKEEAIIVDVLIQRVGNHTWFTKI